jgi:hypothetical protein
MPKAPQNIEVIAPTKNAMVVYQVLPWSTHKNITKAISITKIEIILYSAQINYDAPYLIIMPISTTPGCFEFKGCLSY